MFDDALETFMLVPHTPRVVCDTQEPAEAPDVHRAHYHL